MLLQPWIWRWYPITSHKMESALELCDGSQKGNRWGNMHKLDRSSRWLRWGNKLKCIKPAAPQWLLHLHFLDLARAVSQPWKETMTNRTPLNCKSFLNHACPLKLVQLARTLRMPGIYSSQNIHMRDRWSWMLLAQQVLRLMKDNFITRGDFYLYTCLWLDMVLDRVCILEWLSSANNTDNMFLCFLLKT